MNSNGLNLAEVDGGENQQIPKGYGWCRDVPDIRDYWSQHSDVQELLALADPSPPRRPRNVDLREFFPPVADQGTLNSSTAHACLGLAQYFERRSFGAIRDYSPLFLYKNARRLNCVAGDAGADLRTTLKALVRFGTPPERYGVHDPRLFDIDPDPFQYGFGGHFSSLQYVRLDHRCWSAKRVLQVIKAFLAAGYPAVFGFPVPSSVSIDAEIPFRPTFDRMLGGKAAIVVGYREGRGESSSGALLIRMSWGPEWGEGGYGWLPFEYVKERLAADFWTMLRSDWLKSGEFFRPRLKKLSRVKRD